MHSYIYASYPGWLLTRLGYTLLGWDVGVNNYLLEILNLFLSCLLHQIRLKHSPCPINPRLLPTPPSCNSLALSPVRFAYSSSNRLISPRLSNPNASTCFCAFNPRQIAKRSFLTYICAILVRSGPCNMACSRSPSHMKFTPSATNVELVQNPVGVLTRRVPY